MIYRGKFTSTTSHKRASTICVDCMSSNVPSRQDTAHSLVHALVHSWLDYCIGVLVGIYQYQIDRLQSVQCFGLNARQTTLALLSRKSWVQTFAASSTNNHMTVHILHTTCHTPQSFPSEIGGIWWTVCANFFRLPPRQSWILPQWSNTLEQSSSKYVDCGPKHHLFSFWNITRNWLKTELFGRHKHWTSLDVPLRRFARKM